MKKKEFVCCICHKTIVGEYGNNPYPVIKKGLFKCCDKCNLEVVAPMRAQLSETENED